MTYILFFALNHLYFIVTIWGPNERWLALVVQLQVFLEWWHIWCTQLRSSWRWAWALRTGNPRPGTTAGLTCELPMPFIWLKSSYLCVIRSTECSCSLRHLVVISMHFTVTQLGLGFFYCLHGVLGDHHQQIHQDHPGVQAQAEKHREEPKDQAEAARLGLARPGVGHVHQLGPQHSRGAAGPVRLGPQTLQQLRLPGPERHAWAAAGGVLLTEPSLRERWDPIRPTATCS